MSEDSSQAINGTSWRRALVIGIAAFVVAGGIGSSIATGVLASSFLAQSTTATLVANSVQGDGVAMVVLPNPTRSSTGQVGGTPVARFGIGHATIKGLCLSQVASVFGQTFSLQLRTDADSSTKHSIDVAGVIMDAASARGVVQMFGNSAINKNGADVQVEGSPISVGGSLNDLGLQASQVELKNVTAQVQDLVIPNSLSTPFISIKLLRGNPGCPAPK